MAKNKGKFGKGKPKIEDQDEFVSGVQQVAERVRPYAKQLIIGASVILIAVAGIGRVS